MDLRGMEKANLKRLYTVGFHCYNFLEMTTLSRWRANYRLPGVRVGGGAGGGYKGVTCVILMVMEQFCISIVVVTMHIYTCVKFTELNTHTHIHAHNEYM